MFISITGKPGSGKSYYAMHYLLLNKHKYLNTYTNINGLKSDDNIKSLKFSNIVNILTACKLIYDDRIEKLGDSEKNIIDEPIIDYLLSIDFIERNSEYDLYLEEVEIRDNSNNLYKSFLDISSPLYAPPKYKANLLIIDEAQNHFSKADEVLNWFISYHRHLYIDVLLLSQTYQKIHTSYLRDIEYFLYSVPSSRLLFNSSFRYRHHLNTPFFKTNLVETIKIKKKDEVFALYESGDRVRTKSVLAKPLLILIVLIILIYFVGGLAKDYISSDSSTETTSKPTSKSTSKSKKEDKARIVDGDLKYLKVVCIAKMCENKLFDTKIKENILISLIEKSESSILETQNISNTISIYNLLVNDSFIAFFKNIDKEGLTSFF